MSTRLVCALSGLGSAEPAVALASHIADRLGLALQVVDVQRLRPLPGPGLTVPTAPVGLPLDRPDGDPRGPADGRADVAAICARAGAHPDEVDVVRGEPGEELARLAGHPSTAMLVVPDDGEQRAWLWATRPAGRRLVDDPPCPILAVPSSPATDTHAPSRIVAAVGDDADAAPVAAHARRLADALGASLELVHATGSDDVDGSPLAAARAATGHRVEIERAAEDAGLAGMVAARTAGHGRAIAVVGPAGRGLLGSALRGSFVHDLLAEGSVPVLVVPLQDGAGPGATT